MTVQKVMIDEQSSLVFTLEDDLAQDNETLLYLKKEGWWFMCLYKSNTISQRTFVLDL